MLARDGRDDVTYVALICRSWLLSSFVGASTPSGLNAVPTNGNFIHVDEPPEAEARESNTLVRTPQDGTTQTIGDSSVPFNFLMNPERALVLAPAAAAAVHKLRNLGIKRFLCPEVETVQSH